MMREKKSLSQPGLWSFVQRVQTTVPSPHTNGRFTIKLFTVSFDSSLPRILFRFDTPLPLLRAEKKFEKPPRVSLSLSPLEQSCSTRWRLNSFRLNSCNSASAIIRKSKDEVGSDFEMEPVLGVELGDNCLQGGTGETEKRRCVTRKREYTFEFYWPDVTDSSRFQVPLKNPTWLNFWSNYFQLNKHPTAGQLRNDRSSPTVSISNILSFPPTDLKSTDFPLC